MARGDKPIIPEVAKKPFMEKKGPMLDLTPGIRRIVGMDVKRELDFTPDTGKKQVAREQVQQPDLKKNIGEVIAGWVFGSNTFFKGRVRFLADKEQVLMGLATDYLVGDGVFIGKDQSDGKYKFRLGDPAGDFFAWDGDDADGVVASHASSHEDGGSDEIDVTGLSGLLADPQTPASHTHVAADITDFTEAAQDAVGNAVGNGLDYDDTSGAISVDESEFTTILGGTYTPTASATSNLDATPTMPQAQYMRVGNTVTVSGRFPANATAAGLASFEIDLPVASNLGAVEDLAGVAASVSATTFEGGEILAVAANNTAKIEWIAVDTAARDWSYQFTYQVIP